MTLATEKPAPPRTSLIPLAAMEKIAPSLQRGYSGRVTLHIVNGRVKKVERTEFFDIE